MTDAPAGSPAPELREVAPGLYCAERGVGGGFHNAMYALRLRGGGLAIHSPTRLGAPMFEALAALGEVRFLLAPNHFHHLGLPAYRERFPQALVVASDGARPRLEKKGHAPIAGLEALEAELAEGDHLLRPEGLKNGEVFLSLACGGARQWLVCDAFFHETRGLSGMRQVLFRALGVAPGFRLGQTFLWVGIADRRRYRAWLEAALAREQPRRLWVSHGTPYDVGDGAELRETITRRLA